MAPIDYTIKDLKNVVQGIDGEIKKVDITRLTAPGENFLSLVFRLDFEVEKDGKTKTVYAIAKCLPQIEKKGGFDFHGFVMKNEVRWYSEMVPLLKEFGEEFGIDTSYYPEFLGGRLSLDAEKKSSDDDAVLLLRNLIPDGYKNDERHVGFDLPSSKALLRTLATYHAIPLAMKFKKPEMFKTFKEYLDSSRIQPPPGESPTEGEGAPPTPEKIVGKMVEIPACKPYLANLEALKLKPNGPPDWHQPGEEPWNTVIHSDYWVNNVMVKPREGQEPLVKMVDFQLCGYSSYAKDLVFFMLTSVSDDVQKQHFDELLRYYYDQLTSILEKVDIPELKLKYEDYLEELKRVALESEMGHAIFFSTVVFGDKGGPDTLTGEVDHMEHMENKIDKMCERQKEKLGIMTELAATRGWL